MINILMAGNSGVFDGILINVLSYIKYNEEPVTYYIYTMNLTDIDKKFTDISTEKVELLDKLLKEKNAESKAVRVDIREEFLDEMSSSPNLRNSYTPYAFARLFCDKIEGMPNIILYLDADTVINNDISELYHRDYTKFEFAAAIDYLGKTWISKEYQNSGVMIYNLDKIRETGLFEKCREFCSTKKSLLSDQDALNKKGVYKEYLDSKYNRQNGYSKDAYIVHFSKTIKWLPFFHTQNIKPWQVEKVHKKLKLFEIDDILASFLKIKEKNYQL